MKKRSSKACKNTAKSLNKNKTSIAGAKLSMCRWSKIGSGKKQSNAMKRAWNTSPKLKARKK